MLYITGDTHGNQYKWSEWIDPALQAGDTLLIAGDFGVGFWNGLYWSEETFYDWLEEQPYTVLFCDGNHCDFRKLNAYPVSEWNGGRVHALRKNVIHLMRGEVYRLENGKTLFTMGGGYSFDKAIRTEGYDWWPEEMPSQAEYENALRNLKAHDFHVDYIMTHTAPASAVRRMMELPELKIKDAWEEERELTTFLEHVQEQTAYEHWYFGHFHQDIELPGQLTGIYRHMRELESGKSVRHWKERA